MALLNFSRIVSICLIFFLSATTLYSQDLRLFSIVSPTSGCTLSNAENVSIIVINVGSDINNGSFIASYKFNAEPTVNETVMLPPLFSNGALLTYTFVAPANLTPPDTFNFTSYINIAGDVNRTNDTIKNHIVISYPLTVGGTLNGSDTVCENVNSGNLTLTSYTGAIVQWESSTDNVAWSSIAYTNDTFPYSGLSQTAYYRVLVQSGTCASEYSTTALIKVDKTSVGGTIGDTAVCPGSSGDLFLKNYVGNVLQWESSTDNGTTWTIIPNTTDQQAYTNITVPTIYRAKVKSGVCSEAYSDTATVSILSPSVGGTLEKDTIVCSGSNSGILRLKGYYGSILRWESSTNGGGTWAPIANSSDTFTFSGLTVTTQYRVAVQSCSPEAISSVATVTVDAPSQGGTLQGSDTVCANNNSGLLNLTGYVGDTFSWESSEDGSTWAPISNPGASYTFINLTLSTQFRVKVKNGSCPFDTSSLALVKVDSLSQGGTVLGSTAVCIAGNTGQLDLSQFYKQVIRWESSINNGSTWDTINNSTDSLIYNNLINTTMFRAAVRNGVCPEAFSDSAVVIVDSLSVAGEISTADSTVCNGSAGTLYLTGYRGTLIFWNYSINDSTWNLSTSIGNTETFFDIIDTTSFRASVKNGSCPTDTSGILKINVVKANANAGNDTTIIRGTTLTLSGKGGVQYSWSPAQDVANPLSSTPTASPEESTTYVLTVVDENGCMDSDSVLVTVTDKNIPIASNFVSANGDGLNDVWVVKYIEQYENTEVKIFNTQGREIFSASPYMNNWDGKWNGNHLPDGTYYYILRIPELDQTYKGFINLLSGK